MTLHSFLPALHDLFEYGSYRQVNEKSPKTDLGMRIMKLPDCKVSFLLQGQNPQSVEMQLQGTTRVIAMTDKPLARTVIRTEVFLCYVIRLEPQYFACPTMTVIYSYFIFNAKLFYNIRVF